MPHLSLFGMHDFRKKTTAAPSLRIGRHDDNHELEADRLASATRYGLGSSAPFARGALGIAPPIVHDVIRSSGRPLDLDVRALMNARFHHDFSAIRVHDDGRAATAASAVSAAAFTVGNEIVFGRLQYRPGTQRGRQLIEHELVHAIQQSTSGELTVQRKTVCDEEGVCRCEMEDEPDSTSNPEQCSTEGGSTSASSARPSPSATSAQPSPAPFVAGAAAAPLLRPQPLPPSAPVRPPLRPVPPSGGGAPSARVPSPRWLPISPLAAGIGAGILTFLWPRETAQRWMDELNPYTGQPYTSPDEYHDVQRRRRNEAPPRQEPQPGSQAQPEPQPRPRDREKECRELHPYAVTCDAGTINREQVVGRFLDRENVTFSRLNCRGVASVGAIDACDGAPGERAHCIVDGNRNRIVSVFGCLCCVADGSTANSWRGAHWSVNLSRRDGPRDLNRPSSPFASSTVRPFSRSMTQSSAREAQLAIHVLEGESPAPRMPTSEFV